MRWVIVGLLVGVAMLAAAHDASDAAPRLRDGMLMA